MDVLEVAHKFAGEALSAARDIAPVEACGVMYEHAFVNIRNVHERPTTTYEMDRDVQLDTVNRMGWPSVIWHSHPGSGVCLPSDLDFQNTITFKDTGMMIVTTVGRVALWMNGQLLEEWDE